MSGPLFKVGETAQWTSSSAGSTTTKSGEVVCLVGPGQELPEQYAKLLPGHGGPRKVWSYVVFVPGKTVRSKGQYYWPVPALLKRV